MNFSLTFANRASFFYHYCKTGNDAEVESPQHSNSEERKNMSLKKQYLKKKGVCKVTFSLPKEAVGSAAQVSLVGDFNQWNKDAIPMKRLKNGTFTATLTLEPNKEYHFRYFVDGARWENDWSADKYVPNSHGSEDSVVVV
jgi:1,4-alpha-glucan branching enzyme